MVYYYSLGSLLQRSAQVIRQRFFCQGLVLHQHIDGFYIHDYKLLAGDAIKGPVPGAPLDLHVAYDPPCHLLHAQGVAVPPLKLFAAIPLLELVQVPGAAECCGSAGLFTLLEPEMSRAVLAAKIERLRVAAPQVVATGNPGCVMQIGAGLAAARVPARVRHPVELLDDSYRAAGRYE